MVILDTSVALSWCFEDELTEQTQKILEYVEKHGAMVPSLWQLEVTNALWSSIRRKRLDLEKSRSYLALFQALPIKILEKSYDMTSLLDIACATGLTTYDTTYLVLALEHHLPLATLDIALQKVAQDKGVIIFKS